MADTNNDKFAVLNPVGYPPKVTPKSMAPRLDTLDGKTLYLVDPRFDDSGLFLRQVKDWFAEHMREIRLVIEPKSTDYSIAGLSERIIKRMRERIGLRPEIELVSPGSLPRFELKAKRFLKL